MNARPIDSPAEDKNFVRITDFNFTRKVFQRYPCLRARQPKDGWTSSKPHKGEPYDKSEFLLVEGGWNHEHCSFCFFTIDDDVPYWANEKEVIILCERCFAHYKGRIEQEITAQSARGE